MSGLFDDLARTLAAPMPRGRVVRLIGGVIVGMSVPGVRVRQALGSTRTSIRVSCDQRCPPNFPFACICDRSAEFPNNPAKPCFKQCGVAGSTCCCYPLNGRPTGANACPPGTRCGNPGESSCVCVNTCGTDCCGHNQFCANPRQRLCCNRGERGCGLECCHPNEECRTVRVGTSSSRVCTKRCPPKQAWCGRDKCCPPRWHCVNESTGLCKRCWPNEEECYQKCCDRSTSRCCGKAGCCPKGRSCCNNGGDDQVCCPAGQKCAIPILAGDIGIRSGTKSICCPAERYHASPKLCCPPGQIALSQPGMQVGPGLNPFCCPQGRTCGSGPTRTCCQTGASGTQTCCNGKCVDTQFDPDNCGRCGNVCDSRTCTSGVCAFT